MNAATKILRTEDGYQYGNLLASGLPRAQSHALLLRARGASTEMAAQIMGCSKQNIKQALGTLFFKLQCDSSPALITKAFENGFLRILSIVMVMYLGIFASVLTEDARRGRRDQPRTSVRLARRNLSEPHIILWDEDSNHLVAVQEDLDHVTS